VSFNRPYSTGEALTLVITKEEIPELEAASELKGKWLQNTEIPIDLGNRTDVLAIGSGQALFSHFLSKQYARVRGWASQLQALLALTQNALIDPSRQRLQGGFHSLGSSIEPLLMLASMADSCLCIIASSRVPPPVEDAVEVVSFPPKYPLLWDLNTQNADGELS